MGNKVLRGGVKFKGALADGSGDPYVTRDTTTGEAGTTTTTLTTLTNGYVFVGNVSNVPIGVPISGDIAITNAGVVSIAAGVIVNADVNASAAIAYSKLAPLTFSKALVSDGTGFVTTSASSAAQVGYLSTTTSDVQVQIDSKQATITGGASSIATTNLTANRALLSDASGKVAISAVTNTELGYVSGVTSALQTQLTGKLSVSLGALATGDIAWYNGTSWTNLPRGTNGQALYSTATSIQWNTPTINGIPIGGSLNQILGKASATDFDATWRTLNTASITDIVSTAAEINKLSGVTVSTAQINYLSGASSNLQTQIDGKLSTALAQNAMFLGNISGVAAALSPGSNGQVLQITAGVPAWQTIAGTGSVTSVNVSGGTTGLSTSGGPVTTSGTITLAGTLALANGGTGASLADPNADRIMFWDDSAGAVTWLTAGTGLAITSTTIDVASNMSAYWKTAGTSTLTATTTVESNFDFNLNNTSGLRLFQFKSGTYSTTAASTLNISGTGTTWSWANVALNLAKIDLNSSGLTIENTVTTNGITYANDYSSGYTDRSLVDRGYALGTKTFTGTQTFRAGTATSGTAPLKLTTGTALTTPEDGALEYHTSHLYFTVGATRFQLDQQGGVTNTAAANELMKSNGTNAVASGLFSTVAGNITLGTGIAGATRTVTADGSATNVGLYFLPKGSGAITLDTSAGGGLIQLVYGIGGSSDASLTLASTGSAINSRATSTKITTNTTSTNTVDYSLDIIQSTSATPAIGIGTGLRFQTKTSGSNFENGSTIESISTDITAASEDFDLVFKTMADGLDATEKLRIKSTGNVIISGSLSLPYVEKTLAYTATTADYTINYTSGTVTLSLPTAVGITGRIYVIKNSGAGTITVDPSGAELLDGVATQTLTTGQRYMIQSTGTGWIIIN